MRIKIKNVDTHHLAIQDMPTFAFLGCSLGYLVVGIIVATFGGLFDAQESEICSFISIISGLASIGISIAVAGIGLLYWWLIPRKYGILYPSWAGFGLIIALLGFASGALVATEFIGWLSNGLKV